jgi:hypothetical protein
MKKVNLPDDLESANDVWFTHPIVDWFLTNAGTKTEVDWATFLGDTIKEKHQNLFDLLDKTTKKLITLGAKGYFWIIAHPEMASIFETATVGWAPAYFEQIPLGYNIVMFMGIMSKRWRIYTDPQLDKGQILIGAGFSKKHPNYYCNLKITNFEVL